MSLTLRARPGQFQDFYKRHVDGTELKTVAGAASSPLVPLPVKRALSGAGTGDVFVPPEHMPALVAGLREMLPHDLDTVSRTLAKERGERLPSLPRTFHRKERANARVQRFLSALPLATDSAPTTSAAAEREAHAVKAKLARLPTSAGAERQQLQARHTAAASLITALKEAEALRARSNFSFVTEQGFGWGIPFWFSVGTYPGVMLNGPDGKPRKYFAANSVSTPFTNVAMGIDKSAKPGDPKGSEKVHMSREFDWGPVPYVRVGEGHPVWREKIEITIPAGPGLRITRAGIGGTWATHLGNGFFLATTLCVNHPWLRPVTGLILGPITPPLARFNRKVGSALSHAAEPMVSMVKSRRPVKAAPAEAPSGGGELSSG